MEGFIYDSAVAQGVTALARFIGLGLPPALVLYWIYQSSDEKGDAYRDRKRDENDDQPQ